MIRFSIAGFILSLFVVILSDFAHSQALNRVEMGGKDLFLSGGNVAWVDFAEDIGPGDTRLDLFEEAFTEVNVNGGNTMRLWLHTDGRSTPEWNGFNVIGPGDGAIEDLKAILDLAYDNNVSLILCLWSFDMLRIENGPKVTDRAKALLEDSTLTRHYIDNALIPMVDSLKGHPAIGAWEIFNEPEGMSEEFGWKATYHVPMADIQRFVNHTTSAIKNTDPDALVTNGAWSFKALSDNVSGENTKNYYSDEELIEKGGKENGVLDFYSVHYYPKHFGTDISPFHHAADHWGLDKPIVVAEFYTQDTHRIPFEVLYTELYDRGYAGALVWQWKNRNNRGIHRIYWPRALKSMQQLKELHPDDIILEF